MLPGIEVWQRAQNLWRVSTQKKGLVSFVCWAGALLSSEFQIAWTSSLGEISSTFGHCRSCSA